MSVENTENNVEDEQQNDEFDEVLQSEQVELLLSSIIRRVSDAIAPQITHLAERINNLENIIEGLTVRLEKEVLYTDYLGKELHRFRKQGQ